MGVERSPPKRNKMKASTSSLPRFRSPKVKMPPPPARRPNISERISMLQMAETQHKGLIPPQATKLSILIPPVRSMEEDWMQFLNEDDDSDGISIIPTSSIIHKAARTVCRFLTWPWRFWRRDAAEESVPVDSIRVRLLQEDEW